MLTERRVGGSFTKSSAVEVHEVKEMGFTYRDVNQQRRVLRRLIGVGTALAGLTITMTMAGWAASPALERTGPVQVELYENLPAVPEPENPGEGYSKKYAQHTADDIDLTGLKPTIRYTERAFGFAGLPTKFSKNGLALDYTEPFVLKATIERTLPAGSYQFRLRARGTARLEIDGKVVAVTEPQKPNRSSNDLLPPAVEHDGSPRRPAHYPHKDVVASVELDDAPHNFTLLAVIGGYGLTPDPAELSVSYARPPVELDRLLGSDSAPLLTDDQWETYQDSVVARHRAEDIDRRRAIDDEVEAAWSLRHRQVRDWLKTQPELAVPKVASEQAVRNDIDRFVVAKLEEAGVEPMPLTSDLEFLRRLTIDTIGVIPTPDEITAYLANPAETRRELAIERLLDHPGWADNWVPYWQDVLAENPGILKPDLNNTGPFRWWIHQVFSDGRSLDRMATELIEMEGSLYKGAPRAFAMASLNDAPMAAKADVISQAFLARKLSCARCHDAPFHPFKQQDLFNIAAMLEGKPLSLPESSTVPIREGARKPYVTISLKPGDSIDPHWPFQNLVNETTVAEPPNNTTVPSRHLLATLTVAPQNERFTQVLANRMWKRYMGLGLVEPAHDWSQAKPSHPELLDYLAREIMQGDYDPKHIARIIFSSNAYQRKPDPQASDPGNERHTLFAGPLRRRMTAEQVIDSAHLSVGKILDCEELNLNPLGDRPLRQFLNMGIPQRAWELTALSNERDRPSLALPRAQALVDMLSTFGWRQSRQNPATDRDDGPSPMQTLMLANGAMGTRITRLSNDSIFTRLSLDDLPLEDIVSQAYLRVLSRLPTAQESELFVDYLRPVYDDRKVEGVELTEVDDSKKTDNRVSWANHMDSKATLIRMEEERMVRMGDAPTETLKTEYRDRFEDALWALVNSPEFKLLP